MKTVAGTLRDTVKSLDLNRPKLEEVPSEFFDRVMNNTDFTKTKNSLEAMKLFYDNLWGMVVFPIMDDLEAAQRETGRLILEWDTERRKAEKAEREVETLRKQLQEKGSEGA